MAIVLSGQSPFSGSRTTSLPFDPGASAAFQQRRDLANRRLSTTLAGANLQRGQLQAQNLFDVSQIRQDIAARLREGLAEAASRGIAFSPIGAGRLQRDAASMQAQSEAQSALDLRARLAELEKMMMESTLSRDEELLRIGQEEASNKMALELALLAAGA